MKTYEVTLNIQYVKRYIANDADEAARAMEFDYIEGYIDEEMCEVGIPKFFEYSWHVEEPVKVKNDKNIYAFDARGLHEEEV